MLAPISWGTTYWVVTELMPVDRPLLVAAARVVPAGLLLLTIGLFTSGWRPRGREWHHLALLSLANFGLFFPLLVAATYRVPGGVIASFAGTTLDTATRIQRYIVGELAQAWQQGIYTDDLLALPLQSDTGPLGVLVAAEKEARAGTACAISFNCFYGCLAHLGMCGQAEVVVRSNHHQFLVAHFHDVAFGSC